MQLKSSAFENSEQIPVKYTCDGDNINPPLTILDIPLGTKSLALIVDDPDAGNWVHWIAWNIKPVDLYIKENNLPTDAIEGMTSFGKVGYGGPCPPSGSHQYSFRVYALEQEIDLDKNNDKDDLMTAIKPHIIDQAELVGFYERK